MYWTMSVVQPAGQPVKTYTASRFQIWLSIFFCAVFAYVAVHMADRFRGAMESGDNDFQRIVILIVCSFFFLIVSNILIKVLRTLYRPEIISIYEEGLWIHDYALIPWDKIIKFREREPHKNSAGEFSIIFRCPQNEDVFPFLSRNFLFRGKNEGETAVDLASLKYPLFAPPYAEVAQELRQFIRPES